MASDDDTVTPGAEITVGLRLVGWFRRTVLRRPEPTLILRRRAEIREEIRQNLRSRLPPLAGTRGALNTACRA